MESKFRRAFVIALVSFCVLSQAKTIEAQQIPGAPVNGPSFQQKDPKSSVPVVQSFGDLQPRSPNQIPLVNQAQPSQPNPHAMNQAVATAPNQDPQGSAVSYPQYTPSDMMIRTSPNSAPDQTKSLQPEEPYQQATRPHVANAGKFQPDSQGPQDLEQGPQYAEGPIDPIRALEEKVYSLQCQLNEINTCEGCCESNDNCRGPGGLYFGAGAIFAKPHLKESFQYSQINFTTSRQTLVPFEYDYQSTLRAWVGYRSPEGFGFKVTYWGFDDEGQTRVNTADGMKIYGASAVTVIFPANIFAIAPGETLTSTDFLKTQIINYYGNYETKVGSFDVDGSLGLRYARLLQSLDSFVTPAGGGSPTRRLSWERKYDGLGPAISVDVKRKIGCSGFSVVGQGGGALLFGKKTINRVVIGDQSPQPATRVLVLDEADEVVGIGEMNFGLEWSHEFRGGRNLNIRGLYEGQLWAEAGAPTLGFLGFEGFGVQVEMTR